MKGQFLGLIIDDKPALMVGLLAILKAGNTFVPVNPVFPDDRVHFILNDCYIRVLVTDEVHYPRALQIAQESPVIRHLLCIDGVTGEFTAKHSFADRSSAIETAARDAGPFVFTPPCYVIYTSGSTGRPKGVPITHQNLVPLLLWFRGYFQLGGQTKIFHNLSYTFDFGLFEILTTVIFGGSMVMLNKKDAGDFATYADFIEVHDINTIHTTPAFFAGIVSTGKKMSSLDIVHLGGENLTGALTARIRELTLKGCRIYNGYGPTEATINCSIYRVQAGQNQDLAERESIPIGKPSAWNRVYILNRFQRLQPVGVAGELCVAGIGLAEGYLNSPELTFEKFNQDLWDYRDDQDKCGALRASFHHSILYRSGDLARWLDDGNIEFLGRIDQQVKIRGYRIELGEIENRLLKNNAIKEAVVIARQDEGRGQRYLCAYITPREGPSGENVTVSELREYLLSELPDYMVPAYFIKLEKIPLTPNGKLDRRALPPPTQDRIMPGVEYTPPANETEQKIAVIWQGILGIKRIGREDDFFESGGDSILATQCIARLREEFKVDISLRKMFECPSVKELSKEVAALAPRRQEVISITKAPRDGNIPLSFSQERLWLLQELDAGNVAYFVPRVIRMKGKPSVYIIERTFAEIICRHEILRTVFPTIDGQPVQRIQPPYPFKIPILDLSRLEKEEQEQKVSEFLSEEGRRPFDFDHGPLVRVNLLKLQEEEHLFVLTEHHLVHDGWTQGVLLKEFITIFAAYSEGKEHNLPGLPIQYADYAIWQRSYLQGECLKRHLDYWREKLSDLIPVLELPGDRPRPPVMSGLGALKDFHLNSTLTGQLKEFSRENGVTLFMTMLAVFNTLLYRYTGVDDICVGTGIANRSYKEMEGMLGMVINTLPLRMHTVGDLTFTQYLNRVKETCLEAYQHQDTPFGNIVEVMQPERNLSYTPLFQVLFSFMDTPGEQLRLPGLELELLPTHNRSAKFDINLVVVPPPEVNSGEILVEWEYNTDIFDAQTMERMINHYIRLLEEAIYHPDVSISNLPLLSHREMQRLLVEWNETGADYPRDKSIHELFEEQVERTPYSIALVGAAPRVCPVDLTYRQLNVQSDRLAGLLIEKGVLADNIVGIMMERSIDLIIGILGILKSGGTYLPIDPEYPEERIDYMLKDSSAKILIKKSEIRNPKLESPRRGHPIKNINDQNKNQYFGTASVLNFEHLNFEFVSNFEIRASNFNSSNLAYIMYTSGSTGQPKGVMVTHRNVVRLVKNANFVPLTEETRILQTGALVFDATTFEIWGSLLNGGQLVLVDKEVILNAQRLGDVLKEQRINTLWLSASLFNQLLQQNIKLFTPLRYLLAGGDVLSSWHINEVKSKFPFLKIINGYGPTENTTFSTTYLIEKEFEQNIPIGKPIANSTAYIVDKNRCLMPTGVVGELYVGGDGVARGYLNNPELTCEKFKIINDKLKIKNGSNALRADCNHSSFILHHSILYRTGDFCKWLPDGNIEFLGRLDNQIKIRGFRVELGEIENRLLKHKNIKETVVVVNEYGGEDKNLTAYIVSTGELHEIEVREYLLEELPDYMIPSYFVPLEKIPLTPNGKIDRKALPKPELKAGESYIAPRNEIEKKLVEIWSEVLGRDELHSSQLQTLIGVNDNFFQLGGHSLKATIMVGRIEKAFNVKIPLAEIFKNPRIKELSRYIKDAAQWQYKPVAMAEKKEYYLLSSGQKRLHFLQQMDKDGTAYNIPGAWILEGVLDRNKFEATFVQLVKRHESLRTSFVIINKEPVQIIHNEVEFEIEYYNVAAKAAKDGEDVHHSSFIIHRFIRTFDLSKAPLLRVGLVKEEDEKHILLVDMHHIISDGTSANLLMKEFMALFAGRELPELQIQYKDFSQWQNDSIASGKLKKQEDYWLNRFAGELPALDMPTDFPRPILQSFAGDTLNFTLEEELFHQLNKSIKASETTLYIMLLTVYSILLSKHSRQTDIIIGSPTAGRNNADLEKIVGLLIETVTMRNFPVGDKLFQIFLQETKENTLTAFENQSYPFRELIKNTAAECDFDFSRNPLFDAMLIVQNMEVVEFKIPRLRLSPYTHSAKHTAKVDLTLTAVEMEDGVNFILEYCTDLFKKERMERLVGHFINILREVVQNPGILLDRIDMLSHEEKRQLLEEFNGPEISYSENETIHELLEEQAGRTPDIISVIASNTHEIGLISITYRELDEQSHQLAALLIEKGVLPDIIVGIMMERSVEMIIGIIGILKSGGAYLPIDPQYPQERINFMLKDSGAKLLAAANDQEGEKVLLEEIPKSSYPFICLPSYNLNPSNLAYVIYTSGSTGKPKGVMVEHMNLVHYVRAFTHEFSIKPGDTVLQQASYSFDAFAEEVYPILLVGGKIAIPAKIEVINIDLLSTFILKNKITIIDCSPLLLNELDKETANSKLQGVRIFISGGDVLKGGYIANLVKIGTVYNTYGPTETTICASYYKCPSADIPDVPIGKAVADYIVYILAGSGYLVPIGVTGELCITGPGVTRGYLNRPELTEGQFKKNHRSYRRNGNYILFKTGDLARRLDDGNIEFLGRSDQQVKIRGFRIEPAEIENRLLKYGGIKDAIVLPKEDTAGDKYLIAYIVAYKELQDEGLRKYLSNNLPDYMIPSYFVRLEKIPLNPNGKVDRRVLPGPEVKKMNGYVAPRNEIEKKLVELWSEILSRDALHASLLRTSIGIDDNFFELGGHSLKATLLVSNLHRAFNVIVPLTEIFKTPRIRELSNYIKEAVQWEYIQIEPVEKKEYYALSSAQKRLYFFQQMDKDGIAYNISAAWVLAGVVNKDKLERSIFALIWRHESLRTSFIIIDEEPVQRIHDDVVFEIEYKNLSADHTDYPDECDDKIHHSSFLINQFICAFDLLKAPLLRVELVKLEEDRHLFLLDMHHIISDGISMDIAVKEFMAFYRGEDLPESQLQYKDFSEWQNNEKQRDSIKRQEDFWLSEFEGEIPLLELPNDYVRPAVQNFEGSNINFEIDKETTKILKALILETDVTIYMALLGIYTILLSKLTNQDDIVVGSPVAGRRHSDLEKILGMFVNILALKNSPLGGKTFNGFLHEVKTKTLSAFENQDYQYEDLVERVAINRDVSRNPFFDTVFLLQNMDMAGINIPGLKLSPYPLETKTSKFDLRLTGMEGEDKLFFTFEYSTKLFKRETVERFIVYFKNVVKQVIKNKDRKISDFEIMTEAEKMRILVDFNDTASDYPKNKSLHALFEEQVDRTPDRIALVWAAELEGQKRRREVGEIEEEPSVRINAFCEVQVSYRELNEISILLADCLIEKGLLPDNIVAIMMERSVELIIGIMGILKAGGAYLPIDPEYPQERIQYMLEDSNTKILLMMEEFQNKIIVNCQLFIVNSKLLKGRSPRGGHHSNQLAYIIYTSGSTGKPKGVMVEHRSVVNYITWAIKKYIIREGNFTFPLFTPISFDLTVTSIFTPLLSGNSILIYKETFIDKIIEDNRVEVVKLTPSHLKIILETVQKLGSRINTLIVGGESLETKLVENIAGKLNRSLDIYNEYGPTEAAVGCMIYRFSAGYDILPLIPIGIPGDNVQIYLLDKNMSPVPVGVPGELYIGGDGVARGYLNRPGLTAEKFVIISSKRFSKSTDEQCPMANDFFPNGRLYKTGDLAKFLNYGNIQFLGRIDQQVKIRGFRIELGEIQDKILEFKKHKALTAEIFEFLVNELVNIRRCSKCLLPANYPGIHFDNNGVCNVCLEFETYIDKAESYFKRSEDFYPMIEKIKKEKHGEYDCLLLFSGGKDSTYVLYKLIDMGLKVLTFTFDNGYISEAAFANIKRITASMGIENIVCQAKNMNRIFVESLNTDHNACHGCWNALNTIGIKIAHMKGINLIISGLSRGQIVEMRLEGLFQLGIFDEQEIEKNLLMFRKNFHSKSNMFSRILEVELAEDAVENIHFVDFFRYFDTPVSEISEYLTDQGWRRPGNTGFCSSNCIINDVGIYVHLRERGYHFYSAPLSWDCRLGVISREQGIRETEFGDTIDFKDQILKEIGYYNSPVKDAVVLNNEDSNGDKHICAYIVSEKELSIQDLRKYLSLHLPAYMIPSYVVRIDKIPLTPNGKIDRRALPTPETKVNDEYVAPGNEIEKILVGIWAEVLGRNEALIGINDNFFQLGGHSLKATILVSKLHKVFNVLVPLTEIFKMPRISELAKYIKGKSKEFHIAIEPAEEKEYYELSPAQKRLYVLQQLVTDNTGYNMPHVISLGQGVKKENLESVFKNLIERHENLRTSFITVNEKPVQRIHRKVDFSIGYYEIKDEAEAVSLIAGFTKPFDLAAAPPLRVNLVVVGASERVLFIDMHHIITDGTSQGILEKEFLELLEGEVLPSLRLQYKDYSEWYNETLRREGEAISRQESHWLKIFSDEIPALELPTDYQRSLIQSFDGSAVSFSLNDEETRIIKQFAAEHESTLFMLFLAVFNVLLSKLSGQEDIIIGTPIAARRHADLLNVIGMLVNTLAMRNYPAGDKPFGKFLKEVNQRTLDAFENQEYPFEVLVDKITVPRDTSRNPLFDVMLLLQNIQEASDEISGEELEDYKINPYGVEKKTSLFDLSLETFENKGKLHLKFEYCTKLFGKETILRFVKYFKTIISSVINDPEKKISGIEILTKEEMNQLLFDFNDTKTGYPKEKTIHELFDEQVEKTPGSIAVAFEDQALTYRALNEKAIQLANYLSSGINIHPEEPVAILMERSMNIITAILGVLEAGGAYVPIDSFLPEVRIKYMIQDAAIGVVISEKKHIKILNRLQWECESFHTFLCMDSISVYEEEAGKNELMDEGMWRYIGESEDDIAAGGWISSYTGELFSKEEMREYSDNAFKKLTPLLRKDMRILEIGCASGLTLFRIAPYVGYYYGTDISRVIIEKNIKRVKAEKYKNITLDCLPAHDIDKIAEESFDLIIINSVIQYFCDHNYLRQVIVKAINKLAQKGFLFLGDIMDQEQKNDLRRSTREFKRIHNDKNYRTKTDWDAELFVSRRFFEDLALQIHGIKSIEFSDKIYTIENELTKFRYDTLITIDKSNCKADTLPALQKKQHDLKTLNTFDSEKGDYQKKQEKKPRGLAYMIYTSGTTGFPKGIMIEHRSVINFIKGMTDVIDFGENDSILSLTTISFDIFGLETLLPLTRGCKVVIGNRDEQVDSGAMVRALGKNGISILQLTPSRLQILLAGDINRALFRELKYLIIGGEAFPGMLLTEARKIMSGEIYNVYGPTETTIWSTIKNLTGTHVMNIGRPISNTQIYILDKNNKLLPLKVAGELCIGGDGLARGYLNNPELTSLRFSRNYSFYGSYRTYINYKTGDRARWLPDGNIEFLGRIDHQVKIRGFRIELGEIENLLLKHDRIKETVIILKEDENGDKNLAAYYVSDIELSDTDLREYLLRDLPEYMIPTYFMRLEKIPLTPSAKVDRRSLPEPGVMVGESYTAPRDEIEKKLVRLWAEILARDELHSSQLQASIGIDDNFFRLGGHSLKATIMVGRIEKAFNVKIPLAEIFKNPRINELSGYIKQAASSKYEQLALAEKKEYYALSSAQKRLYFLWEMDKGATAYNIPAAWILEGVLDRNQLEDTFVRLVKRHESLRTSFVLVGEEPGQRIHDRAAFEIEYRNSSTDHADYTGENGDNLHHFIRAFDLSKTPLLRVRLMKLEVHRHIFLVDMHHIISDGMSIQVLAQNFSALYSGKELAGIKLQYKDYAEWQNRERLSKKVLKQSEYWKNEFEGEIPVLELPIDYVRPVVQSFEGNTIDFEINNETSGALKALALDVGATLYMVLLSLFTVLLAKISNREDIVVGTPAAGRMHADLEKIIGMFVNTLALRNYPSGDKKFTDFLEEVKDKTLRAFENQEYQYEDLLQEAAVNRDTGRNPLFDTMFALQNTGSQEIAIPGLELIPFKFESNASKFDLTLMVVELEERLQLTFEYSTKLFKKETVERFILYFINITREVIENSLKKISDLDIMSAEEKRRILVDFNNTERAYPKDKTIHRLFEEQVERIPGRIVLVGAAELAPKNQRREEEKSWVHLSYWELNERAGKLAVILIEKGVLTDTIVGIMIERSIEMIIGIMGILKSGGTYLPIDPEYPQERIDYMLKDSNARFLIINKYEIRIPKFETNTNDQKINGQNNNQHFGATHVLNFDHLNFDIVSDFAPRTSDFNPSSLAYIIYTSGTTGNPKGILVEHISVVNLAISQINRFSVNEKDRVLQFSSICFDASVEQIFITLFSGAVLLLPDKNILLDNIKFEQLISTHLVTHIHTVPSFLDNISLKEGYQLKRVISGGDVCPPGLARKYGAYCDFYNEYGPTETTVTSIEMLCKDVDEVLPRLPLGKPVDNTFIYLLDKWFKPVLPGAVGELYIGGDGVTRGYLNNPELTAERFKRNHGSFRTNKTYILYKTGDLCKWKSDGNIDFLGRLDHQVKIRGYRIELGEIEKRLKQIDGINESVLIVKEDKNGEKFLCAFIVMEKDIQIPRIKEYLINSLPEYMIPSYFTSIEKIPLTSNGKVDTKALPDISTASAEGYIAPRNEDEEILARAWAEVLEIEIEKIGINDNFFDLGGNSLKIIRLSRKLEKIFNKEIPVLALYRFSTVHMFSEYLNRKSFPNTVFLDEDKLGKIDDSIQDTMKIFGDV